MIEILSNWAKNIGLSIVIVSILEMILPNNKTKKYIKMVMGTYVIFCIISPFVKNKIDVNNMDFENEVEVPTSTEVNQESMDRKIKELYEEQMEKDIKEKVASKGYQAKSCKVDVTITDSVKTTKINKIRLEVEKGKNTENQNEDTEKKLIKEVQKIKEIDTGVKKEENLNEKSKLTKEQKAEIKEFLKQEYEVEEKCLIIN